MGKQGDHALGRESTDAGSQDDGLQERQSLKMGWSGGKFIREVRDGMGWDGTEWDGFRMVREIQMWKLARSRRR